MPTIPRKPRVYVSNYAHHDLANAAEFGDIIVVTKGMQKLFSTNAIASRWMDVLKDSEPFDYLILIATNTLTGIGCALFAFMHGRLNLLVHRKGRYYLRRVDIAEFTKSYLNKEALNDSSGQRG